MNFTKKSTFTGILILCCLILCHSSLQAQVMTQQFPREKLLIRLNHIGTLYNKNIVFDTKQVANIEVPALNINSFTVEQTLNATLQTTGLSYKKTAEQSYLIEKKTEQKPQRSSSGYTLKGRIVESETSEPIPGAAIRLSDKQYAVSDMNGYYTFPKVPAGKLVLEVSYVGFKHEKTEINVKSGENTFDIKMSGSATLGEVQVSGVRHTRSSVPHTTEKLLVAEIKGLNVAASGISSEQINKSADRNAADVVRKIAGVSVKDDKFLVVRGMNERYNITYLNDNMAPSTEVDTRAFSLDLIPTRIIDKILVFKTPSPDLSADMTGGAVKIYTKDAVSVKHLDIQFSISARPNTAFNNNFITYQGGKLDFLGFDDGTRKLPSTVPGYGNLTKANISQADYVKSFSNTLYYKRQQALPDFQFTTNYYNVVKIGGKPLSILSSLSYKNENKLINEDGMESAFHNDARVHNLHESTKGQQTAQIALLQNFSFKLNDNNMFYFRNFLLQQGISGTAINQYQNNQTSIYTPSKSYYTSDNGISTGDKTIVLSYEQRTLYSGNLSGKHSFKKGIHTLNWNVGYMASLQQIPDQRIIRLKYNDYTYFNLLPGAQAQQWTAAVRPSDYGTEDYKGGTSVERGIISRTWTRSSESSSDGALDYTFKPLEGFSIKTGTYHQWKERVLFRRVYTVNEGDLDDNGFPYSGSEMLGSKGGYMDLNRVFFKEQDLLNVWSNNYLRDDGSALKVYDRTSGSDAYTATQQNNSYYMVASLQPFHKIMEIYGGVRMEYNRQKVAGAVVQSVTGGVSTPVLVDKKEADWLPSVNVSVRPNKSIVLRAAYGATINRTEFREISPYSELNYMNNQYVTGNPSLLSCKVQNYDLRLEWYPGGENAGNMVSAGAFYKDMKNPIERIIYRDLYYNNPATISYQNATSAIVKGLEVELNQNLSFIPLPVIKDLSFNGNFSLIRSMVPMSYKYSGSVIYYSRQLQGQSPYTANAGLFYENAGSGTKVGFIYNLIGPRIYAAAVGKSFDQANVGTVGIVASGDAGSRLELEREQLDFSLTQRISKGLQLKFSIQNLLNGAIRMAEDENFTYKYEKAVLNVPANYTTNPGIIYYNKITGDPIVSEYKADRYFNLTLTYSF